MSVGVQLGLLQERRRMILDHVPGREHEVQLQGLIESKPACVFSLLKDARAEHATYCRYVSVPAVCVASPPAGVTH